MTDAKGGKHAALCRFFAENLVSETSALKDRVIVGERDGGEALEIDAIGDDLEPGGIRPKFPLHRLIVRGHLRDPRRLGQLQQADEHGGYHVQVGDPLLLDQRQQFLRIETGLQDHLAAPPVTG